MKLRNLMYATMIACAFASCSKDETPGVVGNDGEVAEATLSLMVNSTQTKAAADTDITSLDVVIFKGQVAEGSDPVLEKVGKATAADNVVAVENIPVTSGNKTIVVLANVPSTLIEGIGKYSDLAELKKDFNAAGAAEVDGKLTMNSKVYEVNVAVDKKNYLGYLSVPEGGVAVTAAAGVAVNTPVNLYRNVAKVELNSLAVQPTANYKGGKFTLKGIFLLHGNKVTKLVGADSKEWGATEVNMANALNGYLGEDAYQTWVDAMTGKTAVWPMFNGSMESESSYVNAITTFATTSFYAYENTSATRTLVVVKGDFSYDGVGGTVKEENRYYPIAVGVSGIDQSKGVLAAIPSNSELHAAIANSGREGVILGVLRNVKYSLGLTITGPGYKTPFGPKPNTEGGSDTFLNVSCKVVGFAEVAQSETVE